MAKAGQFWDPKFIFSVNLTVSTLHSVWLQGKQSVACTSAQQRLEEARADSFDVSGRLLCL